MTEDHGASEAGQLPRARTRGRTNTESRHKSEQRRVRSWTVKNEIKGVLGQVSTGAAEGFSSLPILERYR